jgi:hypothetical protein
VSQRSRESAEPRRAAPTTADAAKRVPPAAPDRSRIETACARRPEARSGGRLPCHRCYISISKRLLVNTRNLKMNRQSHPIRTRQQSDGTRIPWTTSGLSVSVRALAYAVAGKDQTTHRRSWCRESVWAATVCCVHRSSWADQRRLRGGCGSAGGHGG